jgi:hypothetical protein
MTDKKKLHTCKLQFITLDLFFLQGLEKLLKLYTFLNSKLL